MAESAAIKEIVSQVAVQEATTFINKLTLTDTDTGPLQPPWQTIGTQRDQNIVD